jgi:DNA-binding transcriptional regulator YiaG
MITMKLRPADFALIAQTKDDLASGRARQAIRGRVKIATIAGSLGVSPAAVSAWFTGRSVPTDAHALALGQRLAALPAPELAHVAHSDRPVTLCT